MQPDKLAQDILSRHNQLKADRQNFDTIWQELADVIQPRKNNITVRQTPDAGENADLYDTTAVDANMVLGAGQLSYITPASDRWMAYEFPEALRSKDGGSVPDEAAKWFQQCTEIAHREIGRSNFYTEVHEMYLDRGGMGTGCLYVAEGKRTTLNFCCHAIGTYSIAEDEEGYVDTVFREFKMTARQAVQRFGKDSLGEKVKAAYESPKPEAMDQKFTFVHAVFPREDRDARKIDGPNKPFASIYVCVDDQTVVRNEGYDELPYAVTRYLVWGENVYGYCPSIDILPTIRQVNFIERQMDALAETAAFPRLLIPEAMKGQVDMRAAGITIFDPNTPTALPKEWATQGRYDIGQERVKTKQDAIRKAYHNDLFQMFAQAEREMTAYEAMQRVAEKLVQFSPTFARLTTEFLQPTLQRVFGILFRGGYFPEPPKEVFIPTSEGVALAMPQVVFTSKVALAIKALENKAFLDFIQIIAPLLPQRPDLLDNFDLDVASRDMARNLGLSSSWIKDADDVAEERAAKAQQMQQAQAMQATESLAKAAGNLGSAPQELQDKVTASLNGQGQR